MSRFATHASAALGGAALCTSLFLLFGMQVAIDAQRVPLLNAEQREILGHLSLVFLDDGSGGSCKTLRISGVNVQIVNGLGSTETADCSGNLIVGYNELGNFDGDDRSGSHNLVVGRALSYSSHGGVVCATQNTIAAPYASVTGGTGNMATSGHASVTGGLANTASDFASSVCGGQGNTASGGLSVVLGGRSNTASGTESVVCSGEGNSAEADFAAVLGGAGNRASGAAAVVAAGGDNHASGAVSSIGGGCNASATGLCQHLP